MFPPFKMIMNKIILSAIPERTSIADGELELDQSDIVVSGALALGAFENTGIEIFRQSIKNGSVVVDIGAHIGYYTVVAGKRAGRQGKVFAYEPEQRNFSRLARNVEINDLSDTVTLIRCALSDKKGTGHLYIDEENKGHHSLASNGNTCNTTVQIQTLDNSLKSFGWPRIDVIKMDIEGAEFLALSGMKETLVRNSNIILFTEFYPKAIRRMGGIPLRFLETITGLGFSLFLIDENRKRLNPIIDLQEFVACFPGGESFKNIYAVRKKY